jgi:hypothetical protein
VAATNGDERIVFEEVLPLEGNDTVAFAISNRSAFLPAKRLYALRDPYYYKKVPLSELRCVFIARHRNLLFWLQSVFIVASAAFLLYEDLRRVPPRFDLSILHMCLIAGMVIVVALRRRSVVVNTVRGNIAWNPPPGMRRATQARLVAFEERVLEAFRQAGVRVEHQARR